VFTTQIVDLDRHRLLDVIEGRSADVLGSWLADRGVDWCANITLATLDPAAGYRLALDTHLPNAVRVVGHFHARTPQRRSSDMDVRALRHRRHPWRSQRRHLGQRTAARGLRRRGRRSCSAPDDRVLAHCADADTVELTRLARPIDRWMPEILAHDSTSGASNGRVENIHMLAEKTRRNAHGLTNHINYRRRLIGLLGIKWATIPTRRIRGRQPHSAA